MAFFGLLQDIANIYSVLSNDKVSEKDFEEMKQMIVFDMHHERLSNYVLNQEPNSWNWNCDMLRLQLLEVASDQVRKYIILPTEQQATYPNAFTVMRSIKIFRFGDYEKAGQLAGEVMRVWSLEHHVDSMSEEFRKKWLPEIQRICVTFRNST